MSEQNTEADWAYLYGQEARKAAELDFRLNSMAFDATLLCHMLDKLIRKLDAEDHTWVKDIPNLLDQKFDMDDNLRNHLMNPVGCLRDNERIAELAERIAEKISTNAEDKEFNDLTHDLLKECNKKVLKEYSEFQEARTGVSSDQNREAHRSQWMQDCPKIFAQLLVLNGTPEELIDKFKTAIRAAVEKEN